MVSLEQGCLHEELLRIRFIFFQPVNYLFRDCDNMISVYNNIIKVLRSIFIVFVGEGFQVDFPWFRVYSAMKHIRHLEMLSEKHSVRYEKKER